MQTNSATVTCPMTSRTDEDRSWVTQTLGGDKHAYARLIGRYKIPLFDLAYRILKDRCQAEDALQDAFLQGYQHLHTFRFDAKFSTWIYAIVLNRVRNQLRWHTQDCMEHSRA